MEYLIAYDPSTDTCTVEDVFSKQTSPERRSRLPTRALTGIDPIHDFQQSKSDAVEDVLPSFLLLLLPLEVRFVIYTQCLTTPLRHDYDIHTLGRRPTLDLLLVNRQIYDEARLIPFRQNVFDFDKWNGTGLFHCQSFLRHLQFWQRVNVRIIRLNVPAVTLISETGVGRWLDLCGELGCSGSKDEGLKTLHLTISGCITKWKETFDLGAPWVASGLLKLHSVQILELTVVNEGVVDLDLLTGFVSDVQSRLHGAKIVLKTMAKGKASTVYFPVSLEAISVSF
jgi:hypothetical protein